jgi:hypothetical protein
MFAQTPSHARLLRFSVTQALSEDFPTEHRYKSSHRSPQYCCYYFRPPAAIAAEKFSGKMVNVTAGDTIKVLRDGNR